MQEKEFDENCKIITVYHNDLLVGFIVDSVNEIIRTDDENVDDTPTSVPNIDRKFIAKVLKLDDRLMLILDLTNVLSPDEENEIKELISKNESKVIK